MSELFLQKNDKRPIDSSRTLENVKELTKYMMILPVIFIPLELEDEVA